jgi:hypothetical protein
LYPGAVFDHWSVVEAVPTGNAVPFAGDSKEGTPGTLELTLKLKQLV